MQIGAGFPHRAQPIGFRAANLEHARTLWKLWKQLGIPEGLKEAETEITTALETQ
jgi:hypothetical protein